MRDHDGEPLDPRWHLDYAELAEEAASRRARATTRAPKQHEAGLRTDEYGYTATGEYHIERDGAA